MSEALRTLRAEPLRRFKPYAAYKDSGVEWLGEIPAHWEVKRTDSFLRYEKIQIEPSEISDDLVFHYSIPLVQETGDGALEPPSDIDSAKLRIVGERLLVSKLNPRKGVVVLAFERDVPTICSTEFVPFAVRDVDARWALYLFLAESTRQRLSAVVRSATRSHQRAEVSEIAKIWHGVPSPPEQRAIAAFLDRATARIDALVAKKERLIELLQEKRTALISRAVTKGLDPTVPMKDSGVEWLGQIPAHWDVKRLKYLALHPGSGIQMGPFGSMLKHLAPPDTGYKLYGQENTISGDFTVGSRWIGKDQYHELHEYRLRRGDIVLTRKGSLGNARIFPDGAQLGVIDSDTIRVRVDDDVIDPRFLVLALHEAQYLSEQICSVRRGAVLGGLNTMTIAHLLICVPPHDEQSRLMKQVAVRLHGLEDLLNRILDAIARLKELRTAVISGAVTGTIDVREEIA